MGYNIVEGRLAVNPAEAPRVRTIFQRYLELGSLSALEREGVTGKRWSNKAGDQVGGGKMSRGALYYLLTSPTYRGITRHKDKRYADTHPAIIDEVLWDAVQAKLGEGNGSQPKSEKRGEGAWLEGVIFDDRGNAMVPVHTNKGSIRYRRPRSLSEARFRRARPCRSAGHPSPDPRARQAERSWPDRGRRRFVSRC